MSDRYTIVGLDEDGEEVEVLISATSRKGALSEFRKRTNLTDPSIKKIEVGVGL